MGGGGSGSQTVTNEFKPPEFTQGAWKDYLGNAQNLAKVPYQQSGLPTVAPINDYQQTAMQLAYDRATYGAPDSNAGRAAAMNAAQGNYANPWAQNVSGIASGQASNPALEGYYNAANSGPNPYTSDEYTNKMISQTGNEMANAWATGGAAQNDASAAMSGAFGGSAHTAQQQSGQAALAKQVGNMSNSMLQQQQQYKGNMYNQDFANQMQALGGYSGAYNQDVSNQLSANAQGGGMYGQDVSNILSGAGLTGSLSAQDFTSMQGLMDAGNNYNTYYQKLLDGQNNQWNTQNMYDMSQNEALGAALGRASGTWGGQSQSGGGASPWGQLGGLLSTGAGLYSMFK